MSSTTLQTSPFRFLEKTQLVKLRLKAMRSGAWFKALPRIDRVLVDLTIKVTASIRSPYLAQSILAIARKLEEFMENKLLRAIRESGLPLARKLSLFAQQWGNKTAEAWANDASFAQYWAVMKLNGHPCNG